MDFHKGTSFFHGVGNPPQIAGGMLMFQCYTNTWKLASGGHGKASALIA